MALRGRSISIMIEQQILELFNQGKPIRKIAHALGISRNTVRKSLRDKPAREEIAKTWRDSLNWDEIRRKNAAGVQINQLHKDFAPTVSYWAFYRYFKQLKDAQPLPCSITLEHNAGEKTQVDYTHGIPIVDAKTGRIKKTHLFCGVLAFSGFTFGEFAMNQTLPSFLRSHVNMWNYFRGVTPYVVVDNLRSGVKKAHRYDPEVNPTYCEFANHHNFAVLPARPYHPRDKAMVETTIGAI